MERLEKALLVFVMILVLMQVSLASAAETRVNLQVSHYAKAEIISGSSSKYIEVRANSPWLIQTDAGDIFTGPKTGSLAKLIPLDDEIESFTIIPR